MNNELNSSSSQESNDSLLNDGNEPGCSKEAILSPSEPFDDLILNSSKIRIVTDHVISDSLKEIIDNVVDKSLEMVNDDEENACVVSEISVKDTINLCRSDSNSSNKLPDWLNEEWRQHKKHIFIFSLAGKPIYSRHGDEDRQASLFGTLLTLSQFLQHAGQQEHDYVRHINAGSYRFVFNHKDHLILVAASAQNESHHVLTLQLNYLYNQILSILTLTQLRHVFERRHNFDLRRLLYGAEKFLEHLVDSMDEDLGLMSSSIRCLPLDINHRNSIAQIITSNAKIKDLLFVILIAGNELVCLVHLRNHLLHPSDLLLLFNLINSSESFKNVETWTPICLPRLDPNGFLHAHISYANADSNVCLILLSINKDSFYTFAYASKQIIHKLESTGGIKHITDAVSRCGYKCSDTGVTAPLHFFYKSHSTCQYTSPLFDGVYADEIEKRRLVLRYQSIRVRMHNTHTPISLLFHAGDEGTVLAKVCAAYDFFIVFNPFVTKSLATSSMNKLLRWIKDHEDRLFILSPHTV